MEVYYLMHEKSEYVTKKPSNEYSNTSFSMNTYALQSAAKYSNSMALQLSASTPYNEKASKSSISNSNKVVQKMSADELTPEEINILETSFTINEWGILRQRTIIELIAGKYKVHDLKQLQLLIDEYKSIYKTTILHTQVGPSCWIFVVESLLRYKGVDTEHLLFGLQNYRSKKEVPLGTKGYQINKRRMALYATYLGIEKLLVALRGVATAEISETELKALLNQYIGRTQILEQLPFSSGVINVEYLKREFSAASKEMKRIADLLPDRKDEDSVDILLKPTRTDSIDSSMSVEQMNSILNDIKTPCYMNIRKGYKKKHFPPHSDICDLTTLSLSDLTDTRHALLCIRYDSAERKLYYKNPLYGNVCFIVTIEQLQGMCGQKSIKFKQI